jgi:hypothetical protein
MAVRRIIGSGAFAENERTRFKAIEWIADSPRPAAILLFIGSDQEVNTRQHNMAEAAFLAECGTVRLGLA